MAFSTKSRGFTTLQYNPAHRGYGSLNSYFIDRHFSELAAKLPAGILPFCGAGREFDRSK
jgi:hypothetical protein